MVEFYHKTLKESPEALRYLESRGLTHSEMIGHFKLGFASRKLGLMLPDKNRKAGADLRGRLQRLHASQIVGNYDPLGRVVATLRLAAWCWGKATSTPRPCLKPPVICPYR